MKRFIEGLDRSQTTLLPDCVDDYVDEDNPVRAIDAFVDMLDLAALGFDVEPEATGRPGYHPATMLKLYLYGYLNQVQSSRRLERECARNLELIWLTGRLKPDFKTIADFRRDNGPAIRKVCRQFVALCRDIDLLDAEHRRHRRQQVQGRERQGEELHAREAAAAPGRDRRRDRTVLAELDRADEVLSQDRHAMPSRRGCRASIKKLAHYKKEADTLRAIETAHGQRPARRRCR